MESLYRPFVTASAESRVAVRNPFAFRLLRRAKLLRNLLARVRVSRTVFRLRHRLHKRIRPRRHVREGRSIRQRTGGAGARTRRGVERARASERGHVYRIFPFGDVEIRVNRFFRRNSRSIDTGRSHPPTPIPKLSSSVRG